jgi:hypothetical protein
MHIILRYFTLQNVLFMKYDYSLMINNYRNLMILCRMTLVSLSYKKLLYYSENMEIEI